ncbi:MAG: hypothetical protein DMF61_12190 [Blastocatellia bacterium AA13]|nr:MAG: hypothetical protein DMF61_12190 [Blastocatellia bacterium AA13]
MQPQHLFKAVRIPITESMETIHRWQALGFGIDRKAGGLRSALPGLMWKYEGARENARENVRCFPSATRLCYDA